MSYSFEYIDIILLAMIAGFIFLRLRGILGKRTGYEGKSNPQFQEIIENEIIHILEEDFSLTPREFYVELLKLKDDTNNSTEIMQILFSVLSFEDFARDMKQKAKTIRLKMEEEEEEEEGSTSSNNTKK